MSKPARDSSYQLTAAVAFQRQSGETAIIVAGASNGGADTDPSLIKSIARGFAWFEELATGRAETATAIAKREGVSDRYVPKWGTNPPVTISSDRPRPEKRSG